MIEELGGLILRQNASTFSHKDSQRFSHSNWSNIPSSAFRFQYRDVRFPPARYSDVASEQNINTWCSKLSIEIGGLESNASSKCWTLKPDGPHAVPLGKVHRVAPILKVGQVSLPHLEVHL